MLKLKIPFYYIAIAAFLGGFITYLIFTNPFKVSSAYASDALSDNESHTTNSECGYNIARLNGFAHIRPLLYAEPECESPALDTIKNSIASLIETEKSSGKITSASFYLKVFSKGKWTSYNADEHYHPASLTKLPVLITFMKMAEAKHGLLDQKLSYEKYDHSAADQYYTSKSIEPAHSYSIKELLRYMIAYSDNQATTLLWAHMDFKEYDKTFTDLGLSKPSFDFDKQQLTAREYTTFLKVLYNASYLSSSASEYCFSLLSQADFKKGLLKKLPSNIIAAHKFGECTYEVTRAIGEKPFGKLSELHESGVIYCGDTPYLLTVMTKGPDMNHLSDVVGDISSIVFDHISKHPF